jgi:hypothetical protein
MPLCAVIRQFAHDWTFFFRPTAERAFTLRQIIAQRVAEFVQLLQAPIDIRQFSAQEPLHLPTPFASSVIAQSEQLANFAERQPMELRLLDEANASQRS